jgi:hypothetical protein
MASKTTINIQMPSKRINVPKFQGVHYGGSSKKRHLGKPDRCFDICYRDSRGKLIWEIPHPIFCGQNPLDNQNPSSYTPNQFNS